jgi:SAM-dependent methyltransferase
MAISDPTGIEATLRRFEIYYDAKWLPMHEYFRFHRLRFLHSVEFLDRFVKTESNIGDLVQPGDGPGPLSEFFAAEKNSTFTLITSDLRGPLDVPSSQCDLVVCTETIEHIKDKESTKINDLERFNYSGVDNMLAEIGRILRTDGSLFITTPNSSSYTNLYKWLMDELPYMDPNHVREYTVELLSELCARHGFHPIEIVLKNSWGSVPQEALARMEEFVGSFPVHRQVSRAENIYALYRKT